MFKKYDGWRIKERYYINILENAYKNRGLYIVRIDELSESDEVIDSEYKALTEKEIKERYY